MSNYVTRHGRKIEVIQLPAQTLPRRNPFDRVKFVQIPARWIEQLAGESGRTYDVALLILQLTFRNRGRPVKLSNEMTLHLNMDHTVKSRAIAKLESLGLISAQHRRGAAPLVTLLRRT